MSYTRNVLLLSAVLAFGAVAVAAQTPAAGSTVIITSSPAGAEATLEGDLIVRGVTPAEFNQMLIGNFKLVVRKDGYETHTSNLLIDPTRETRVDVRLSPKTRVKAAARSVLIPGWGQRYTDQKTKGFLFTLLAAGSVAAYFVADERFDDKDEEFQRLVSQYDTTSTYSARQDLLPHLTAAQEEAYDAENLRRWSIGAVIGVWGWSLLDTFFFFPDRQAEISVKGLSIAPQASPTQIGIQLTRKF